MKTVVRVLILMLLGLLVRPGFVATGVCGSCVLNCMKYWSCSNPSGGHCAQEQNQAYYLCEIRCKGQTGTGWGAIAYSAKDKIAGWSFENDYKGTAEQVALQYCNRDRGANCVIRVDYLNSCGAVAADGDMVASGTAGTKTGA